MSRAAGLGLAVLLTTLVMGCTSNGDGRPDGGSNPDSLVRDGTSDAPRADASPSDGARTEASQTDLSQAGEGVGADLGPCTLSATSVTPDAGFNLKQQTITVAGNCFDGATSIKLVHESLQTEHALTVKVLDVHHLSATVPPGVAVGYYTVRVSRGAAVVNLAKGYAATSSIVVAGYSETLYVADISSPQSPVQVVAAALPARSGGWNISTPRVSRTGTRVYFGELDGVYGCDLLACTSPQKVTGLPAGHDSVSALSVSRTAAELVFEAHLTSGGAGQNDYYVIKEDGTGLTKVFDLTAAVPTVGGETYGTWGVSAPVFSLDGQQIAFLWSGHCNNRAGCSSDFTHGLLGMNRDGSAKKFLATAAGEGGDWYPGWTGQGALAWCAEADPWDVKYLPASATTPLTVDAPAAGWPWVGWAAYSPIDDAIILQPFNTNEMQLYPLTATSGSVTAGTMTEIKVPDPSSPGDFMSTYAMVHWFGWAK